MTDFSEASATGAAPGGAVRLSDWGVIRARGDDARTFLHGQLTNDMQHLAPGRARLAGYCSPKGRLLATFVAWQGAGGEVLLACSADLLPQTLKRLSMFVLRSKCRLDDASAEVPLWGLAGKDALHAVAAAATPWSHVTQDGRDVVTLPAARVGAHEVPRALLAGKPPALPALAEDDWRWLEAASGVPRVMAATVEQFVPQMVNLELVGGVDFKKGCYPGQEVVARSQYRGTLKRRAFVLSGPAGIEPGDEVFDAADPGQPAGMVALAGCRGDECAALVELKIAAFEGGRLHAGAAGGPALARGALPYEIPIDAG